MHERTEVSRAAVRKSDWFCSPEVSPLSPEIIWRKKPFGSGDFLYISMWKTLRQSKAAGLSLPPWLEEVVTDWLENGGGGSAAQAFLSLSSSRALLSEPFCSFLLLLTDCGSKVSSETVVLPVEWAVRNAFIKKFMTEVEGMRILDFTTRVQFVQALL